MKRTCLIGLIMFFILGNIFAAGTKYEAENATLTGVTIASSVAGYSGTGYVNMQGTANSSVAFTVNVAATKLYSLNIGYNDPYDTDKDNDIYVNGSLVYTQHFAMTAGFTEVSGTPITLNSGTNTISIVHNWGYMYIDYIIVGGIGPVGDFSVDPAVPMVNELIVVDATGSYDPDGTIVSYAWSSSDGQTASGMTADFTYDAPGTYYIELTMTDNEDNQTRVSKSIDVVTGYPTALFKVGTQYPEPSVSVTFDASTSFDLNGSIVSYDWDFGDGNTGSGVTADNTYATNGSYWVTLTVTDDDGMSNTKRSAVFVAPSTDKFRGFTFTSSDFGLYEKVEGIFDIKKDYTNVYDPDEVQVDAIVRMPNGVDTIIVPCFYFEGAYYDKDDWAADSSQHYWMMRYAPSIVGDHDIRIRITDNDGVFYTAYDYSFTSYDAGKKGFLKVDTLNKQCYRFDTGEPYFPEGINLCWSGGSGISPSDKMNDFTVQISKLSDERANWIRYWLCPWGEQALEWQGGRYDGIGYYNQFAAAQMDSMANLCSAKNVFMQLVFYSHGLFSTNVDSNWDGNPYNTANGGYLASPDLFFSNVNAMAQAKKMFRYIVARWGYSTNIFMWEFFNEVNFTGTNGSQPPTYKNTIDAWHDTMSRYVEKIDPFNHIQATSSSTDDGQLILMDDNPAMDALQFHVYNASILNALSSSSVSLNKNMDKAVMNGEFGLSNDEGMNADILRKAYWNGLFNMVPVSYWYWGKVETNNWYTVFKPVQNFIDGIDIAELGLVRDSTTEGYHRNFDLTAKGLTNDSVIIGYIYDAADHTAISKAELVLHQPRFGYYKYDLFNTQTGNFISTDTIPVINYYNDIELPVFDKEIAYQLRFLNEYDHPIAMTGRDTIIGMGGSVDRDASQSFDPAGNPIIGYLWNLVSKPATSSFTINSANSSEISINPDVAGDYEFELIVWTAIDTSIADKLEIIASAWPVAVLSDSVPGYLGSIITIDGSGSYDPEGDPLTFTWDIISEPDGSSISLNIGDEQVSIFPRIIGEYVIQLIVNDGYSDSEPDTTHVFINYPTGIEDYTAPTEISLYPNPARDYVIIKTDRIISRIELVDLSSGRMISVDNTIANKATSKGYFFDLSAYNLTSGLYAIRAYSDKGVTCGKLSVIK